MPRARFCELCGVSGERWRCGIESQILGGYFAFGLRKVAGRWSGRQVISSAGSWFGYADAVLRSAGVMLVGSVTASHECDQVIKGTWGMPRRREAMKDVVGCEKPRGAVKRALIRGCPNGETRRHWATRWRHLRVNS